MRAHTPLGSGWPKVQKHRCIEHENEYNPVAYNPIADKDTIPR